MGTIRFRFAAKKAFAALHWMLQQRPSLDLHTILKACYFADKEHLNAHGRPVFGASYRAMRFGPVPVEVYEMLKGEAIWLAEIGEARYPWELDGYVVRGTGNQSPNLDCLSESDLDHIRNGLERSCNMNFNERTAATHGPDWQAAELGMMRYEDMIEGPGRDGVIARLNDTARYMRL